MVSSDGTPPSPPVNLSANGANPSPWKNAGTFSLTWTLPIETDAAPITKAHFKVLLGGEIVQVGEAPADTSETPFVLDLGASADPGKYELRVWLEDAVENADPDSAASVELRLDKEQPTVSNVSVPDLAGLSGIPIAFTAADALSGVSEAVVFARKDDGQGDFGAWTEIARQAVAEVDGESPATFTGAVDFDPRAAGTPDALKPEGASDAYQFFVRAIDAAGNSSAEEPFFLAGTVYDGEPPVTTASIGDPKVEGSPVIIGPATPVTLTVEDGGSGTAGTFFAVDPADANDTAQYQAYAPGTPIPGLTGGAHAVFFFSRDAAGNAEAVDAGKALAVFVDATAPFAPETLAADGANPSPWKKSTSFSVTWTLPAGTGAPIAKAHYEVRKGGQVLQTGVSAPDTSETPFALDLGASAQSGMYELRVWLEDAVENADPEAFAAVGLSFDSERPVVPGLTAPSLVILNTIPLAFTVADAISGVREAVVFARKDDGQGDFGNWTEIGRAALDPTAGVFPKEGDLTFAFDPLATDTPPALAPQGDSEIYQFFVRAIDAAGNASGDEPVSPGTVFESVDPVAPTFGSPEAATSGGAFVPATSVLGAVPVDVRVTVQDEGSGLDAGALLGNLAFVPEGIVGFWDFENGLVDASGQGNDLAASGNAGTSADAKKNGLLAYDGDGSDLTRAAHNGLNGWPEGQPSVTIMAWVKHAAAPAPTGSHGIVGVGVTNTGGQLYIRGFSPATWAFPGCGGKRFFTVSADNGGQDLWICQV